MTVDIVYIRKDLLRSCRAALDEVIAERIYLARLSLPPFDLETAFHLRFIANSWPAYCAVANGEVVGWADVNPIDIPECAHRGILGMGIVKAHRGRGLGARLIEACIAHAPKSNLEKIELTV